MNIYNIMLYSISVIQFIVDVLYSNAIKSDYIT